jgi:hypothetical protein
MLVWMVLMLVVVEHSRPRVVRRMMIWRWQALRLVGVMLEEQQSQQCCKV